MNQDDACAIVGLELGRALNRFPQMASPHEGYAVVLEEMDELWDIVKADKLDPSERRDAMVREATQVAAMALRFLMDCC